MIGAEDALSVSGDIGMACTFEAANINAAAAEQDKISLCMKFLRIDLRTLSTGHPWFQFAEILPAMPSPPMPSPRTMPPPSPGTMPAAVVIRAPAGTIGDATTPRIGMPTRAATPSDLFHWRSGGR